MPRTKILQIQLKAITLLLLCAMIVPQFQSRVQAEPVTGDTISTVAGTGDGGDWGDGGPANAAGLYNPSGVAVDRSGNLYIADTSNHRIRKVAPDGTISTVAGTGTGGYSGDGGQAVLAQLYNPAGVAVDDNGSLYIADTVNNRIRKVAPDGTISTVTDQVLNPLGVTVDGEGNLYIADNSNNQVKKVTPGGTISTIAGTGDGGYSGDGSSALAAELNMPSGVAVDLTGNVYIADTSNHVVRRVGDTPYLIGLTLSSGALSPAFALATTEYTQSVANNVDSITITPTLSIANKSVTISVSDGNGALAGGPFNVASGTASSPLALSVGSNTIPIVVTAQDGTTKTYTLTITRAVASGNASLSELTLSSGTLSPEFDSGTTRYTAGVGNAVTSLTVTPTLSDSNATVTVNGIAVTDGSASGGVNLSEGSNSITVVVTASDGTTKKTYTVTVTRRSEKRRVGNECIRCSRLEPSKKSISPLGKCSRK